MKDKDAYMLESMYSDIIGVPLEAPEFLTESAEEMNLLLTEDIVSNIGMQNARIMISLLLELLLESLMTATIVDDLTDTIIGICDLGKIRMSDQTFIRLGRIVRHMWIIVMHEHKERIVFILIQPFKSVRCRFAAATLGYF